MSHKKKLDKIRNNGPQSVEFGGELSILEASGEQAAPRFEIQAYNGGKLSVKGHNYPVVVDLATATFERAVTKINRNHEQTRELGHTDVQEITATGIRLAGPLSVPSKDREEIIEAAKNKFPWDASIEAAFPKPVFVERGKRMQVNGQMQSGPFYVARNAVITGTAILNRGADRNTVVTIAAEENLEELDMKPELKSYIEAQGFDPSEVEGNATKIAFFEAQMSQPATPEVPTFDLKAAQREGAAEAQRQAEITTICASHGNPTIEVGEGENKETVSLAAHAIKEGLDVREVKLEAKLFELDNKSGGAGPAIHVEKPDEVGLQQETLCASLAMTHFGVSQEAAGKSYSERAMNEAVSQKNRQHSLHSIMGTICAAAGMPYTGAHKSMDFWNHTLEAQQRLEASGTSTLSLPNMFENVLNKTQLASFEEQPHLWREVAHVGSVNDFRKVSRVRLTEKGGYRRIGKDGEIKHVGLEDSKRENQADTFGAMMSLTRKDIINDDLGALSGVASMLGMMAGQKIEEEFWITLLSNQGNFFSAANKNLVTETLDITGLTNARDAFMNRVSKNKKPIMVGPALLVGGIPLTTAAADLYTRTEYALADTTGAKGGAAGLVATTNHHAGKYRPVITPYLSNTDIRDSDGKAIPNQADNKWFLLTQATAMLHAIEVVFLNGMQSPTTSTSDMEFNKLGIQYRSYHDFGMGYGDPEAALMSN